MTSRLRNCFLAAMVALTFAACASSTDASSVIVELSGDRDGVQVGARESLYFAAGLSDETYERLAVADQALAELDDPAAAEGVSVLVEAEGLVLVERRIPIDSLAEARPWVDDIVAALTIGGAQPDVQVSEDIAGTRQAVTFWGVVGRIWAAMGGGDGEGSEQEGNAVAGIR